MKREEKDLLLKDLCARLPYGVKIKTKADNESYTLLAMHPNKDIAVIGFQIDDIFVTSKIKIDAIKPYLRPISSMTEEEQKILEDFGVTISLFSGQMQVPFDEIEFPFITMQKIISYLYSIHIDINGMIPKGLAIEVTEDNNPYKE